MGTCVVVTEWVLVCGVCVCVCVCVCLRAWVLACMCMRACVCVCVCVCVRAFIPIRKVMYVCHGSSPHWGMNTYQGDLYYIKTYYIVTN